MRDYTFENFAVGKCNEEAFLAVRAAAEGKRPVDETRRKDFGFVFLCGGAGTGKTHLLRACENFILQAEQKRTVRYLTADDFVEEMLGFLRHEGTRESFARTYGVIDVLLLDDVQYLEGKETTQQVLTDVIRSLRDHEKTVILTGIHLPEFLKDAGLQLIHLDEPEYEVRLDILRRRLETLGLEDAGAEMETLAAEPETDVRVLLGRLAGIALQRELAEK